MFTATANEKLLTHSSAYIRIRGLESPQKIVMARSALELILGVTSVDISTEAQRAHVHFDPRRVRLQQFCTALRAVELDAEIVEMQAPL